MQGVDDEDRIQTLDETTATDGSQSTPSTGTYRRGSRSGKRNKPTLSCAACVSRKSKCDRGRPGCLACYRRQTACEYSAMANIIASTDTVSRQKRYSILKRNDMVDGPPRTAPTSAFWPTNQATSISDGVEGEQHFPPTPSMTVGTQLDLASFLQPSDLPHATHERPALFTLFGMSRQHPFQNFWTTTGGLAEVISVLPTREQADLLVRRYFEVIDPLYPIVPRQMFMADYRRFWDSTDEEKNLFDAAQIALQFAMYAAGMQYMETPSPSARETASEFYLSSCHQSLCISSYLNHCSLATLQTMILVLNYLIASHRVSDAWTFSGITQRQVYGLQLHRDPAIVYPDAPAWENQVRCRLWQAVMFQDTSLSLYLELPPATMYYDITPGCLKQSHGFQESVMAFEGLGEFPSSSATDISYLCAMWQYAQFVQECMCVSKSLKRPMSRDIAHKSELVARLKETYLNLDPPFNSYAPSRYENQPPRLARQLMSLSSNYFFALTILYMDRNDATGVQCDVFGALEASHEAMSSYFALTRHFPTLMDTWGAAQTRAYAQATMIAKILADQVKMPTDGPRDPRLMLAKSNLDRYIDILVRTGGSPEFEGIRLARLADLQDMRDKITVV